MRTDNYEPTLADKNINCETKETNPQDTMKLLYDRAELSGKKQREEDSLRQWEATNGHIFMIYQHNGNAEEALLLQKSKLKTALRQSQSLLSSVQQGSDPYNRLTQRQNNLNNNLQVVEQELTRFAQAAQQTNEWYTSFETRKKNILTQLKTINNELQENEKDLQKRLTPSLIEELKKQLTLPPDQILPETIFSREQIRNMNNYLDEFSKELKANTILQDKNKNSNLFLFKPLDDETKEENNKEAKLPNHLTLNNSPQ